MIHELDGTLRTLLERELPSSLAPQVDISFDPPDSSFAPTNPAVNLFLYDIQENREMRRVEPLVERQENGMAVKRRPPARVECSYLVTAWSADTENEHMILGEVMQALLRHPVIAVEFLQGMLATANMPLPTAVLQPGRLQSPGEFWQAMGGKPRAALHYTVTLAVPLEKEPLPTLITTKAIINVNGEQSVLVQVPDVVGVLLETAEKTLTQLQLKLQVTAKRKSEQQANTILEQRPVAGEAYSTGHIVAVVVATQE